MGWLYGWNSIESLKRDKRTDYAETADSAVRIVDEASTKYGRNWWVLFEVRATKERFVALYLISGSRHSDFGYKDMDESMGPVECDCPLRLLNAATPLAPDSKTYAAAWRDKVRAHHAAKSAVLNVVKSLKVGDKVMLKNKRPAGPFTVTSLKPLRGEYGYVNYRLPKGAVYLVEAA